jgi:phage tail tube protein FII
MEVRIHGKDQKTTYGKLREIDEAFFEAFANSNLPLEIDGFTIYNIEPRQYVPDIGTKDRKEAIRDYLFYFV